MSRTASFVAHAVLLLSLPSSLQAESAHPKAPPQAPASGGSAAPPSPPAPPSAPPVQGTLAPIVKFPHAIHRLVVRGDQLFFTHAEAEKGFKADPIGVSKASISTGTVTRIWKMGQDGPNPATPLGVTKDWIYLTMELNYWDTTGGLFRVAVAGGQRAELSKALVRQALVNEHSVVWLEGKAGEQATTVQIMPHDGAPKALATFPETVTLVALTENELLLKSSKLNKAGMYEFTLQALSLKDGRQRVLVPKFDASQVEVFGKDVIFANLYGQIVAHPLSGGPGRTLLGTGGRCGAQGAISFAVANGYLYWAERASLKRCGLAAGKAEVVGSVSPSVTQLVAADARLFAVVPGNSPDGTSLIFRYDLP